MMPRTRAFFSPAAGRRHAGFLTLYLLFVSFRLLALLLFRPGGFITDFSDYDFYYTWGTLVPMGYRAYDNLWTAYPPLFPALMLTIFEWAARIPPWVEPRLFFHLLLGLALLVFDSGNLILIYRLAGRLVRQEGAAATIASLPETAAVLIPPLLYTLFFVPVYTLIGWFEPMPLFFTLLALDLLLTPRPWGWVGSAVAVGLGFLTKLTPILVLPVAVRYLGARLSWRAARDAWFRRGDPGNLARPALYSAILLAVVVGIGAPFVRANPDLALSSFRVQSIRPPWQSLWAVIDGFYGYGLVPLDMRNLQGLAGPLWESRIPWGLVGLLFLGVYLWLYTRAYDWARVRTPLVFSAVSVILLFLYSKGWSPQYLIWVLAFIALLLPTGRGVVIAVALSLINFVEADVFLLLLPEEHWIMVGTVLARTALLALLLVEFLGQIWPAVAIGQQMRRVSATASWAVVGLALAGAVLGTPRAAAAYWDQQQAGHPCRAALDLLQAEAGWPNQTIVTQQPEVWRDLYPWLRHAYTFHVLDGYIPDGDPAAEVLARANRFAGQEFWWIERPDQPDSPTSPRVARDRYFAQPNVHVIEEQTLGACRLFRVLQTDGPPLATAAVDGGPIRLVAAAPRVTELGDPLRLVLYWQAEAPVTGRYTVFTQLLDPEGAMIAQQDNWPVRGLAPTDTWQPATLIRDPYELALPDQAPPAALRLRVGLYDAANRVMLTTADGATADHLVIPVEESTSEAGAAAGPVP
jgi:hypothetical protein